MSQMSRRIADLSPEQLDLLSRRLIEKRKRASSQQVIVRREWSNDCPLSFAQQRLWFLDQLEPGESAYNMPLGVSVSGPLRTAVLEQALGEIVRRHEALRTGFAAVGGEARQRIVEAGRVSAPVTDLRGLGGERAREEAVRLAREEAGRAFDLSGGPLLRARVLRVGEGEHVVLLTMHHIISDGWSMGVLIREIAALYEAFNNGRPSPLPELPIQYADFAHWQREWLRGEVLEAQLSYWRAQLAGAPPLLELPTERPRPAMQSFRGAAQTFTLSGRLTEALEALSRSEGVTLFMTLLSAWQTLLSRYSGQTDIVVGSPIANRNRVETEGLIGFFANMLPLRTDLSDNPTFKELLARTRDASLGAYAHQDVPFEMLVEDLEPKRHTDRSPLFQVVFSLQNAPASALDVSDLRLEPLTIENVTAKFDLVMNMTMVEEGMNCSLEYSTELFDADSIARMLRHFQRLLEAIIADPEQRISELPLLTPAEQHQTVTEWNGTQADYPRRQCIHQLFEAQAARTPEAVAVAFGEKQLSYRELNARAEQLANYLQAAGVRPGVYVGLYLEHSLEMIVGLLGVLKAGAAYVPLDPEHPESRLSFMLENAQIPLVLTQRTLAQKLPAHNAKVLCLDADWDAVADGGVDARRGDATPEDVAYVIYTSGSTGQPKGVKIQHRALVNYIWWAKDVYLQDERLNFALYSSLAFDLTVTSIYTPLVTGNQVVVYRPEAGEPAIAKIVEDGRAEVLKLTPSHLALIADRDNSRSHVKRLVVGGEALETKLARRIHESFGGRVEILNEYGPTEATVGCMIYRFDSATDVRLEVPVGKPAANVQIYVLDDTLNPVAENVLGELYISGDGLAEGYLNREELTAEKFIDNPFIPGRKMYRTGDLARRLVCGDVEYAGRRDEQVKFHGYRVELNEIKSALNHHPQVRDSIVTLGKDRNGHSFIVAYYVSRQEIDAPALREFLRGSIIEATIPNFFVHLKKLPLTLNGKVNKRALPSLDEIKGLARRTFTAPRTPTEEALVGIWAEVLGVKAVGIHDNFFELGGHSLLTTQVLSRVREIFRVELALRSMFETPTPAGLAESIDTALKAGQGLRIPPLEPAPREGALPLSYGQQRLWFLDQLSPGAAAYNITSALRLSGDFDISALENTFSEIIRRHEVLRTTFEHVNGVLSQVIAPPRPFVMPVTDISEEPQREATASRLAAEDARRPFDLGRGPLLRASLLRLAPNEHILLFTMHHIVSDGWSMGVLVREVVAVYEAFAADRPSPLPELPVQYADYAVWQRKWLTDEVLEKQLDYWRGQLGGELPVLELPTDRPRALAPNHRGDAVALQLPESLSRALKELSQHEGTTLFMTLLAGWQLLLSRYSGQEQVIVGTPTAGRSQLQTEGLIGFFVNTLAMRLDLSGDPTVRELLQRIKEVALGAYAHQDVPFDKLVEVLQPERSLTHESIFQVMFSLDKKVPEVFEAPGLKLSAVPVEAGLAKFDLILILEDQESVITGMLEYDTDLFDRGTVERMLSHLRTLLESAVADPERRLSELTLLSSEEERRVLVEWNDTAREYPRERCVHELFEEQAARTPDAVALVYGDQHLTYESLDRRSNQLARYLRRLGVGPEARVGVLMERSGEMVVTLLAILKAGAAYVPLDLSYPAGRLAYMVADSGTEVVLVGGEREREVLGESDARVVELEAERARIARESGARVEGRGGAADGLAYVIYTSGSTGNPKGVAVSHRAIGRLLINTDYVKLTERDRIAQAANSSFDAATFEIWGPLLYGARLVGITKEVSISPAEFAEQIVEQGITGIFLTTALFNQMASQAPWGFRFVRDLLFGGESVDARWVREVLATAAPERLLHVYGPTETTTFATWHLVQDVRPDATNVPIGRPIANTELYVLGENLRPVPVGLPGQLYIGGDGLARGYLNRPGLTAERFVPHPFDDAGGARLYRTGDLVRYLSDGSIEFLGRIDNQVKVRGFRIELGEIEAVLTQHEAVREAVVVVSEGGEAGKQLVAYVVGEGGREPKAGALRDYLKGRVPEYMLPSAFVTLDFLPLTPNGKIDRKALPAPTVAPSAQHFIHPRTPLEALIADIWSDVLGVDRVSADGDFFALGGHSLLATQVISRLRHLVGVEVPLRALFEWPTVSGLAAQVEATRRAALGVELPPLVARPRDEEPPLSFAQQRLWFLDQLEPGESAYNMPLGVSVSGPLRTAVLEQALGEIVRRHEALRTGFAAVGGEARQRIVEAGRVSAPVTDLRGLGGERAREEAVRLARAEAGRAFDLSGGPLLRARVLRVGEGEHVVLLTMHHIISDGWSIGVLVRELVTLYESFARGEASPLDELEVQYADYAVWQREWLRGEVLEKQLSYWRKQLAEAPAALELPTDYRRTALQRRPGATQALRLSDELSEQLKGLSRGRGVTTFMTLLAGWQLLLSRYSGQERVSVGTPVAGRGQLQTEGLIGLFLNTLVIHSDLSGNPTFNELLERVRDVSLGAFAHQDVPFEKLVEELQPERSLSRSPLFQVMFTFQNTPQEELKVADLLFKPLAAETQTAQFDLALSIGEQDGVLAGSLEYNTDLFDSGTIERMLSHFQTLLENAVSDPERQLSDISLLSPEEERRVMVEWNRTAAEYPRERCMHELFEEQAARTPDAVALMHGERHLTYGELNRHANRLARYLRRRGAVTEQVVGLYLERSVEMVVCILGVFKAGAAYLALDPSYPAERVSFMLADAGVRLVLTREGLAGGLPPSGAEVVCLDAIGEALAAEPSDNAPRRAVSSNTAYVVYTSGSTGQPKGVSVQHDSLVNYVEGANASYQMGPSDRMLQFASFGFDVSAEETFIALTRGATLVLRTEEMLSSASNFLARLREWQVTAMELPTAYWHQLTGDESREAWDAARQLRMMIIGGESARPERVAWWQEATGGRVQLFNACGPTEITIGNTLFAVPVEYGVARRNEVPIGYTMPNYESYVLDDGLRPTPVGVAGEMYVGGVGVARGYLNRPGLTAEKFVPHPFSDVGGARLYRTGDAVRYLNGGEIELLGRVDNQVKVRGFRIELGEVEAVLTQHEAVRETAVVVREDERGDKRLVAYLVPSAREDSPEPGAMTGLLRAYLKGRLPEYMAPSAFVMLDSLPLTPNGKVDRKALPALDQSRPDMGVTYIPPRTPTEELLADIWSRTLGVEQVGVYDNFFNLGGDSIRSVRIVALAKERGLNLSLQQLFQHQTIAELTQEIGQADGDLGPVSRSQPFSLISDADRQILPDGVEDAYPLTMLQAGMLFDSEYGRESVLYHNTTSLHLRASFDPHALRMSVEQLLRRHPVLRTSFDLGSYSEPLQLVHQTVPLPLQVEDLRHLPEAEQNRIIAEWEEDEKQRPFDWSRAPLLRFHVHLRGEETFQFSFAEHHAILDGWSLATMLTELFGNYLTFLKNPAEPAEPIKSSSFRDFVELERAALASDQTEQYWKRKLSGSNMLVLPRWPAPRETPDAPQLYKLNVPLSAELSDGLKRLANLAGVPVKSVLLAAHLKVMGLLGGQSDVLTGLVSHGRPETADAEQVLGLFLNALPFRLPLAGGSWVELARQTFDAERELLPFRYYPMAQMRIDQGGQPLFETIFNFTHFRVFQEVAEMEGIEVLSEVGSGDIGFTLIADFGLDVASSQVTLLLTGRSSELGEEQMEAIGGYYAAALAAMASEPLGRYERRHLLTADESRQALVEWNDTRAELGRESCIHQLFAAQAESAPDAVALVFEDEQLTYQELNGRANQLARRLQQLGVGPDVLVGILMERSVEMVVGLLAVLKAGGAYVPLDPAYPQQRLAFMLDEARAPVVLTQERFAEQLRRDRDAEVLALDTDWETIARLSDESPAVGLSFDNLAYMIYTSGSTGAPKGAMNTHRGIHNRLLWMQDTYGLTPEDRVLQKTPFSFDVSVWEFFWPLITGARLVLARPGGHQDSEYLVRLIREQEITTLHFVPSMLQVFLEERGVETCSTLRRVICSGEALPFKLQQSFFTRSRAELHNLYGPTEAAVDVTHWACEREGQSQIVPIGKPIANTQAYVLDKHLEPVPRGVAGELHLGGVQLARGYFKRAALTAERFIPNPFSDEPGARLYATGDLARHIREGEIEYLGRIDNQVKVRGFRIELGEIEAVLAQHEVVREAVVLAREDERGDKRLVAYLVLAAREDSPEPGAIPGLLRAYLKERVPEYMTPSAFVVLDSLPLTPNGKVDRKALPAPELDRAVAVAEYVAPRSLTEQLLASIWQEVLGVERVGALDNFFELGGHSLLATQVIARLRALLRVELGLRAMFEQPQLAALARRVDLERQRGAADELAPIVAAERGAELELSFAQQRLWFLEQLEPGSALYNIPAAVRLSGRLDFEALERALQEVMRRHEVLRTSFVEVDGRPVQVIAPEARFTLPFIDLGGVGEDERREFVLGEVSRQANAPFDLTDGPMLRTVLLRLSEEEHVLSVVFHHIVSDGWSLSIFAAELSALYQAFMLGQPSPLPEPPVQYADYALWQRRWISGPRLQAQIAYWRDRLAGAPPLLELPTDFPRPAVLGFGGAAVPVGFTVEEMELIKRACREHSLTPFMALLAAFHLLLSRYSRQPDVSVGTPFAGRTQLETEGLIGFFVNTLVLRVRVNESWSVGRLWKEVRETVLGADAHQEVPFERLVEELQPERSLSYGPLFQVMFAMQNTPEVVAELERMRVEGVGSGAELAKFDLTLALEERDGHVSGSLTYSTELFARATAERMVEQFRRLALEMAKDAGRELSRVEMLSAEEHEQVVLGWNQTQRDFERGVAVHELFERRAESTPDAVALVYGDEHLTYGALSSSANRLARYLRRAGVGPETAVGVLMDRSPSLVISLLAVLKAGGCYVPLDPSYPSERLAYMVADSGAPVVLVGGEREREALGGCGARVVSLEAEGERIAAESADGLTDGGGPVGAEGLAYVVYTSGSTGTPKGVAVSHASLLNLVYWHLRQFEVSSADHATQLAGLAFDASVWELWPYLVAGATLHLAADDETRISPPALQEWLLSSGITISFLPTPTAERVLGLTWPSKVALRTVLTGGDRLTQYPDNHIPFQLVNNYGPTENTVVTTSTVVPAAGDAIETSPPIGRPIDNVRTYILDERGRGVPVGVAGELYIAGESLARGYLNQPATTSERFIADPYSDRAGARMYWSGDLARYKADGSIEFLGRVDQQVKVRGYRIELGEIEAVLGRHPLVGEAVVLVREDTPGDKSLAAYVVAKEASQTPAGGELREYLQGQLPDYMIPAAFVMLEELPLTPNGKIDRRALPALKQFADKERTIVAPRNAVEERLAQIWQEVLGSGPVSVTDNFFELGGHSLLAVRLMSRIKQQWGHALPLATLFQRGTIEHLAILLDATPSATQWSPLVALQPDGARRPFFCVHPVGGNVLCYVPLASHWGTERPLYGLQAQGLGAGQVPSTRIEEMARQYVEAMRVVQPEGPYLLGGWSMGGVIAFEMARQLQARQQEVALLALFDSHLPADGEAPADDVTQLMSFAGDLGLGVEDAEAARETLARMERDEQLAAVLDEAKKAQLLPTDFAPDDFHRLFDIFKANWSALSDYVPQPYAGKVTLLSASERIEETTEPGHAPELTHHPEFVKSWEQLATEGVESYSVPGGHYTIVREPNVGVLAARLKDCIERADENLS